MCSRSTCSSCSKVDECGWCDTSNAVAVGECIAVSEAATCSASLVTDGAQCPTVGGDVSEILLCVFYQVDPLTRLMVCTYVA